MQKDLKIGMFSGLAVVFLALIYISTRPGLSTKARMLKAKKTDTWSRKVTLISQQQSLLDTASHSLAKSGITSEATIRM